VKFTPPDYASFCGNAADGAFDNNLNSGWPSDAPSNRSSGVGGSRSATVRLPRVIDVTRFAVASGGTCGDTPDAGVKKFMIQTKSGHGGWITAVTAKAPADGLLHVYQARHGTQNVRQVRFVMLSNHGNTLFMDVLEVSVRGA
jgi:hypothetical protein